MSSNRRLLSALIAIAALAACSDEGPVSGPGTLTASLVGPNGAEGAALVVVSGEGVGEITAVGDTEVFSEAEVGRSRLVICPRTSKSIGTNLMKQRRMTLSKTLSKMMPLAAQANLT